MPANSANTGRTTCGKMHTRAWHRLHELMVRAGRAGPAPEGLLARAALCYAL